MIVEHADRATPNVWDALADGTPISSNRSTMIVREDAMPQCTP